MERMFMPAIQVAAPAVPLHTIAEALVINAQLAQKLPAGYNHLITQDDRQGLSVIGFPMSAEEFINFGFALMERLHSLCEGNTPEDGCEFLCCLNDGIGPAPAAAIYPSLYVSDTKGEIWGEACHMTIKTTQMVN